MSAHLRWINVVAFLGVVVVNGLAVALPLNGIETGAISDRWPTRITPADFAFSIWSVLYLWLAVFVVYQAFNQSARRWTETIGWLFVGTCVANAGWLLLWHHQRLVLALGLMVVLLLALIAVHVRLTRTGTAMSAAERFLVRYPFSAYLGWITVAVFANTTIVLEATGVGPSLGNPSAWPPLLLMAGATLGAVLAWRSGDPVLPLAIAWGFAAIAVKQAGTAPLVTGFAWTGVVVLAVAAWVGFRRSPIVSPEGMQHSQPEDARV